MISQLFGQMAGFDIFMWLDIGKKTFSETDNTNFARELRYATIPRDSGATVCHYTT